jgi:hypothetical protein
MPNDNFQSFVRRTEKITLYPTNLGQNMSGTRVQHITHITKAYKIKAAEHIFRRISEEILT